MLGDQQVRAGDKVVIWFGAANRDPDGVRRSARLDLRRDPNPHVAFGVGPHFCLGAHLARLEMSEMLRHLLEQAPGPDRVGEPTRVASNFINGIAHLPVHRVGTSHGKRCYPRVRGVTPCRRRIAILAGRAPGVPSSHQGR